MHFNKSEVKKINPSPIVLDIQLFKQQDKRHLNVWNNFFWGNSEA